MIISASRFMRPMIFLPLLLLIAALPLSAKSTPKFARGLDQPIAERLRTNLARHNPDSAACYALLDSLSGDTLRAAAFLLAYAPAVDAATLSPDWLRETVQLALATRKRPWAAKVPWDIFLHYVLPDRIAQEPLERFRPSFAQALEKLADSCSTLEEAALRVNLWSIAQATYQPTSGRDQGPLTTWRRGIGRCEEEMIFYIAAARSAGIPARTCSTPYWNFTDNNHAWVEVFDGKTWRCLGASEPEGTLGRAWFSGPTRRATLVDNYTYGLMDTGQVLAKRKNTCMLNSTPVYTSTRTTRFMVVDAAGKPVDSARVVLHAVSYGAFLPFLALWTDATGTCELQLGRGGVFVIAAKDSAYGYGTISTMGEGPAELKLTLRPGAIPQGSFSVSFPILSGEPQFPESPTISECFAQRKAAADAERRARVNNDPPPSHLAGYLDLSRDADSILACAEACRGNLAAWIAAFRAANVNERPLLQTLLRRLPVKDRFEVDSLALAEWVEYAVTARTRFAAEVPETLFTSDVLLPPDDDYPRIPWRTALAPQILPMTTKGKLAEVAARVLNWFDARVDTLGWDDYLGNLPTPLQALRMGHVQTRFRDGARALALQLAGVPARSDPRLSYWNGKAFIFPDPAKEKTDAPPPPGGTILLRLMENGKLSWAKPWERWNLGPFVRGQVTYSENYDADSVEQGWRVKSPKLPRPLPLVLQTASRNDNGDARVTLTPIIFPPEGKEDTLTIVLESPSNVAQPESLTTEQGRLFQTGVYAAHPRLFVVRGRGTCEPCDRLKDQFATVEGRLNAAGVAPTWLEAENWTPAERMAIFGTATPGATDFPFVLLLGKDARVLYRSRGYNMDAGAGIIRALEKKP